VRGRYGDLGGVSERCGFRVSVRARERDRQLGDLPPAVVPVEGNWWARGLVRDAVSSLGRGPSRVGDCAPRSLAGDWGRAHRQYEGRTSQQIDHHLKPRGMANLETGMISTLVGRQWAVFALRQCLAAAIADERIQINPASAVPCRLSGRSRRAFYRKAKLSALSIRCLVSTAPSCWSARTADFGGEKLQACGAACFPRRLVGGRRCDGCVGVDDYPASHDGESARWRRSAGSSRARSARRRSCE
jgi:hypothetical protein